MSAGIKRMLAEREAVAEAQRLPPQSGQLEEAEAEAKLFSIVDRAATFIDEGAPPNKWKPSTALKLAYYMMASSPRPGAHERGASYVETMLERARQRHSRGLHPNPFDRTGEA